MKKKKIARRLLLNKNTVVNLSVDERLVVKGGYTPGTCGWETCLGTNCPTYDGCQWSESCLHMCYTEKLYETCNPLHC
jgi:hypothetical protein